MRVCQRLISLAIPSGAAVSSGWVEGLGDNGETVGGRPGFDVIKIWGTRGRRAETHRRDSCCLRAGRRWEQTSCRCCSQPTCVCDGESKRRRRLFWVNQRLQVLQVLTDARLLRRGGVFSEIRLRVLYWTWAKEKSIKNLNSALNCSYIFFFFFLDSLIIQWESRIIRKWKRLKHKEAMSEVCIMLKKYQFLLMFLICRSSICDNWFTVNCLSTDCILEYVFFCFSATSFFWRNRINRNKLFFFFLQSNFVLAR